MTSIGASTAQIPSSPAGARDRHHGRDAVLSLRGVTKQYGDAVVVDDVSIDVEAGEFITLLGPSGSGKTTTLNMIAGFTDATRGQILLDGRSVEDLPTHRRNIGVVFQHYALFPHLTAEENVAFPLKRRKVGRAERDDRTRQALDMVRLEGFGRRYPHELSGGQQQRVAFARALVFNPRLLLMDEPLGALDKKLREWLQGEIKRIHRALGITFLYVTHDQEEALSLSDRIAIFNDGRIEQLGTADDLYERPRSVFVAEFLGESNRFTGPAEARGSEWVVQTDGLRLVCPAPAAPLDEKRIGTVVVRPERMTLTRSDSPGRDGENTVAGTIDEIIYLGAARKVTVRLRTGGVAAVREAAGAAEPVSVGDEVQLSWRPQDATLLPHAEVDLEAELEAM